MKKKLTVLLLLVLCFAVLSGCCDHQWQEATCTEPSTCAECGETEGEALGHDWQDATCTAPQTCERCGRERGEMLAHTWVDATCSAPKTCSVCKLTEGEPLAHTWVDATCSAPKTCSVCAATEGEPLPHTWTDATCQAPKTCSVCAATEGEVGEHVVGNVVYTDADYVAGTAVCEEFCMYCEASMGTSDGQLEKLHADEVFFFSPAEFMERMNNAFKAMEMDSIFSASLYVNDDLESMPGSLSCDIYAADEPNFLSYAFFYDIDTYYFGEEHQDLQNAINNIYLVLESPSADSNEHMVVAMFAALMACDPKMELETIADLTTRLVTEGYLLRNGIEYYFTVEDAENFIYSLDIYAVT